MAHPELDELLTVLLPFAQDMLERHGEFYPFAGVVTNSGEVRLVAAVSRDDQPDSLEVIADLDRGLGFRAAQGEIRAAAICLDVRIVPPDSDEKTDAICARLEHLNGESPQVFLPYTKSSDGELTYGELFAEPGPRTIFATESK